MGFPITNRYDSSSLAKSNNEKARDIDQLINCRIICAKLDISIPLFG